MDNVAIILDYATPGGPPAGTRFVVERHADGVTLVLPTPPQPALGCGLWVVAAVILFALMLVASASRVHPTGDRPPLALTLAVAATMVTLLVAVVGHMRMTGQHDVSLSMRGGRFTMLNGPRRLWGKRWTVVAPRGFSTSFVHPDPFRMRVVANLRVRNRFGLDRQVLIGLPCAECQWLARELDAALRAVGKG